MPTTDAVSVGRDAEGAFVCAEAAAVVKVIVLRALSRRAVACEALVRTTGTVRVRRVEGTLTPVLWSIFFIISVP